MSDDRHRATPRPFRHPKTRRAGAPPASRWPTWCRAAAALTVASATVGLAGCYGHGHSSSMRESSIDASVAPARSATADAPPNPDAYEAIADEPFRSARAEPLSTFALDVDTTSFTNVRRMLRLGHLPPHHAVRLEEMVNAFEYELVPPAGPHPIGVTTEIAAAPWADGRRILRIAVSAESLDAGDERPPAALTFLVDVSGSMAPTDRLPLVKKSLRLLVDQLGPEDTVSIVTYAGSSAVALEPTAMNAAGRRTARRALDDLGAGGSTAGADGLRTAYDLAEDHLVDGGVNRVILCTDGDFNVGMRGPDAMQDLIERRRDGGVYLTVLGFGTGNWQDGAMERLSNHGNGNAAYIDSMDEARKVLRRELASTLIPVARDVKVQVDFNPGRVSAYRLLGYSNRVLADHEFTDDSVDAGELGAGRVTTALYEIIPTGVHAPTDIEPSKYIVQSDAAVPAPARDAGLIDSDELCTVRVSYKPLDDDASVRFDTPVLDRTRAFTQATPDMRHATAVAGFAMLLRDSDHTGALDWDWVASTVEAAAREHDPHGDRRAFVAMVRNARDIQR